MGVHDRDVLGLLAYSFELGAVNALVPGLVAEPAKSLSLVVRTWASGSACAFGVRVLLGVEEAPLPLRLVVVEGDSPVALLIALGTALLAVGTRVRGVSLVAAIVSAGRLGAPGVG